jgi:hypothetical protein
MTEFSKRSKVARSAGDAAPDFIQPQVQKWTRLVFGAAVGLFLAGYQRHAVVEPGHGPVDVPAEEGIENSEQSKPALPSRQTRPRQLQAAQQPPESAMVEPADKPEPSTAEPIAPVTHDAPLELAEQAPRQAAPLGKVPPQDIARLESTRARAELPPPVSDPLPPLPMGTPAEPQFEIVSGVTAPGYTLSSLEAVLEMARVHQGRFLVSDGELSVEIGRKLSLSGSAAPQVLKPGFHKVYAKRMVELPPTPQVDAVIAAVRRSVSQLRPDCKVYLSVPHEVDSEIFRIQRLALGNDWDVRAVTEIRFVGQRCEVVRVHGSKLISNE